ncbi:MAG: NfeD family protein [Mariprofundaceae bacterium]|nr:NfeD family protein [Mariprofundaceae bacterium]
MDFAQYFSENHSAVLFVIAAISLAVELTIIGLSGPLLFFALACFTTAFLSHFGVVNSWESETLSVGLLMVFFAAILWKPLQAFQNSGGGPDTSSDMIGQQVACTQEITQTSGNIRYSGIQWNARLAPSGQNSGIAVGEVCVIAGVDGNVMLVQAIQDTGNTR